MLPPKHKKLARALNADGKRNPDGRVPALPDVPDIRDLPYQATLRPLPSALAHPQALTIMDQGKDGACTGFGLAAAINLLIQRNTTGTRQVSPYMLYRMARMNDEWPGEEYEGSSLRGALRGFFNNGACQQGLWGRTTKQFASLEAAKDARRTALGAYYRLRPVVSDYHAALNETGVVYVSAAIHSGWDDPPDGIIESKAGKPLHAFILVGYDERGFWVQNSWGPKWGKGGLAHWSYQDWAANIQDAWVLQLAVEAPDAFGLTVRSASVKGTTADRDVRRTKPTRMDIAGHFVHVRNGRYATKQPYWSSKEDVAATAGLVAGKAKHRHLLIYAHGGLNTPDAAAARTAAMTPVFMDNGIYPYAVFYDTGLIETLTDVVLGRGASVIQRSGGLLDVTDMLIERMIGDIGTKLWTEMKADASLPFKPGFDGEDAMRAFVDAFAAASAETPTTLHLAGHSTGAIVLGHLLDCLDRLAKGRIGVGTCSLMAPACTVEFYRQKFLPRLGAGGTGQTRINEMTIYGLDDHAEQADQVTPAYNKSLLYLVSNAFEDKPKAPILGMQKFNASVPAGGASIRYASSTSETTRSTTHGGFDNDTFTMNDIARRVLGAVPVRPFSDRDLDY